MESGDASPHSKMTIELELVCPVCQATELCGPSQMLARMRTISILRREAKPESSLIVELFRCSADKFTCHSCDAMGLTVREPADDGWNDGRKCIDCSQLIPPERLEVFPDAVRCAQCESKQSGALEDQREFCPKCGEVLVIRQRRGSGISKYEMSCPRCRSRHAPP
jgi:hypothetical protein